MTCLAPAAEKRHTTGQYLVFVIIQAEPFYERSLIVRIVARVTPAFVLALKHL
jgi:hypothetical protein